MIGSSGRGCRVFLELFVRVVLGLVRKRDTNLIRRRSVDDSRSGNGRRFSDRLSVSELYLNAKT